MSLHIQTCLLESSRQRNTQNMYENVFLWKKIRKLFTWFLKLYLSVGAFLQKWLPCLISDVNLCRMKTNKVGIIWTLDLAFNDRFDIPSGKDPAYATFFLSNSSHTIFLFKLWRKIHLWRKKLFQIWRCWKYGSSNYG